MPRLSPNVVPGLTVLSISLAILIFGDVVTPVCGETMAEMLSSLRGVTVSEPKMIIPNQDFVVWKSAVRRTYGSSSRLVGEAKISPKFIHEIRRHAEGETDSTERNMGAEDEGVIVPATILTETSDHHVDYYAMKVDHEGRRVPVEEDNRVAFVLLNDNPDAFFDHKGNGTNGGTSVPIVRGSIVSFQGGVPHNTVINSGVVAMLGPFDIRTFSSVGDGVACAACPNDSECSPLLDDGCSEACGPLDLTGTSGAGACAAGTTFSVTYDGSTFTCPCQCQECVYLATGSSDRYRGLMGKEDGQPGSLSQYSESFHHHAHQRDLYFIDFIWELLFGKREETECETVDKFCVYTGPAAAEVPAGQGLYCLDVPVIEDE